MKDSIKVDNSKNILLIVGLFILIFLIAGISFALSKMTLNGTQNVTLVAKDLQLNYVEGTSTISVTNAIPQEDSDGLASTPYNFSLKNTGTRTINYDVYLDDDTTSCNGCSLVPYSYLSYDLKKDGTSVASGSLASSSNKLGSYSIAGNTTQNFELRTWLNLTAENDAIGKSYYGKVRISAVEQLN